MNLNQALATLETAFPERRVSIIAEVGSSGSYKGDPRQRDTDTFVVLIAGGEAKTLRQEGPSLSAAVSFLVASTKPESASAAAECIAPAAHPMSGRPVPASVQAQRETALDGAAAGVNAELEESVKAAERSWGANPKPLVSTGQGEYRQDYTPSSDTLGVGIDVRA